MLHFNQSGICRHTAQHIGVYLGVIVSNEHHKQPCCLVTVPAVNRDSVGPGLLR